MKRLPLICTVLILASLPMLMAIERTRVDTPVTPVKIVTPTAGWLEIGTITDANATLAVADRDYASASALTDANSILWTVPNDVTGLEMRFQCTADANAYVVELWVAADNVYLDTATGSRTQADHFMLGGILTLTGGKQVGPHSNVFCDTMTAVHYVLSGTADANSIVDSAADRIAVYRVDLRGYKRVLLIATTCEAATTLYADVRWY